MKHKASDYDESRSVLPVSHEVAIDGITIEDLRVFDYLKSVKEEADAISFYPRDSLSQDEMEYEDYQEIEEYEGDSQETIEVDPLSRIESPWERNFLGEFLQLKQNILDEPHTTTRWASPETSGQWRKYMTENPPPSYEIIRNIEHVTTIRLIANLTSWLSTKVNDNLSLWIYTLFLRIDNVLDYNDCAVIRGLGKKALRLLTVSDSSKNTPIAQYTFQFILLIMYHYYHQKDIRVIN